MKESIAVADLPPCACASVADEEYALFSPLASRVPDTATRRRSILAMQWERVA
jgi:hypothetical protein